MKEKEPLQLPFEILDVSERMECMRQDKLEPEQSNVRDEPCPEAHVPSFLPLKRIYERVPWYKRLWHSIKLLIERSR